METILEFADRIEFSLTPIQRIVLKLAYDIPLDNQLGVVQFTHPITGEEWSGSELEWWVRSLKLGRSNGAQGLQDKFMLVAGRRSGKSRLMTLIALYEIQNHQDISIGFFSTNQDSSGLIQDKFIRIRDESISDLARMRSTWSQKGKFVSFRENTIKFTSAHPNHVRGDVFQVALVDEAAFIKPEFFRYLTVSTNGRTFLCGTPSGRKDHFRKAWQAKEGVSAVQIPAWEMNPMIPAEEFRIFHDKDPLIFQTEYGAEWEPVVPPSPCDVLIEHIQSDLDEHLDLFWSNIEDGRMEFLRDEAKKIKKLEEELKFIEGLKERRV